MSEQPRRFRDLDPEVQEAIKKKIRALVPACTELVDVLAPRLPVAKVEWCRTQLWAGEWGLMLDSLCATLVRRPVPVTSAERSLLDRALTIMGDQQDDFFTFLNDRRRTLDALTMLDDAGRVVAPVRPGGGGIISA